MNPPDLHQTIHQIEEDVKKENIMKKIMYILLIGLGIQTSFGQSHRFSDLGILFNQKELSGTARYRGLSGAMGALGGDISTINQNPAGLGVFNHNDFSISLGNTAISQTASYYGNSFENNNDYFNLNQLGVAFVFDRENSDWKKTVLAINYQKTYNFNSLINVSGNSGFASFNTHPLTKNTSDSTVETDPFFNIGLEQSLENRTSGKSSVFNIGIASQYKDNLYLGGSLNIHNIDISQKTFIYERNTTENNTLIEAKLEQEDYNSADGISFNFGLLYKLSSFLRVGLAYESPTWYTDIINESNIFDDRNNKTFGRSPGNNKTTQLNPNDPNSPLVIKGNINLAPLYEETNGFRTTTALSTFEYNIKTASKFNISSAFILGKTGLISLDYSYHNYDALSLSGDDGFSSENNYFSDLLKNTHNIRGGGEIRIKDFTIRGGLSYEQSAFDKNKTQNIDVLYFGDKYGASLGAGLRIENHKFDLSYNYIQQKNSYDFYDDYNEVTPVDLDVKQSRVNVTYSYIF